MTQATPTACRGVAVLSVIAVVVAEVSYRSSCGGKVAVTASVEGEQSDRGCESAAAAANF